MTRSCLPMSPRLVAWMDAQIFGHVSGILLLALNLIFPELRYHAYLLIKIGNSASFAENRCREADGGAHQLGQWPGVSNVLHIGVRGIGQRLEIPVHGL